LAGLIDRNGNWVIEPQFVSIYYIDDGAWHVSYSDENNTTWRFAIDSAGNELTPRTLSDLFADGNYFFIRQTYGTTYRWAMYTRQGEQVIGFDDAFTARDIWFLCGERGLIAMRERIDSLWGIARIRN